MASPISISAGALDVESIVSQLMQIERQPITVLQGRQSKVQAQVSALDYIRTDINALKNEATALARAGGVLRFSASSSDSTVATATVASDLGATLPGGSLNFTVDQLAQAHGLRSNGIVGATSATVTSAALLAVAGGAGAAGVSAVHAGAGLAGGKVTVTVEQASPDGTAARMRAGTGPAVDLTGLTPGQVVSLDTGAGTLDITVGADGLRTGSFTTAVVSTGDRSLGAVAAAINGAGVGASAAAVKVADGQYRLQVTAANTGSAGAVAVDGAALDGLGGLIESSAARDAVVTVGSGPGAYQVRSATNTFSGLLPGITIAVATTATTAVTVSAAQDNTATVASVKKLVEAVNAVLLEIRTQTAYNPTTKTSAALAGDATVRRLADDLRSSVSSIITGGSLTTAGQIGISIQRDGSFRLDEAKLTAALQNGPATVARLFGRGGTSTAAPVTVADGSERTAAGTYHVVITSPPRAADSGVVLAGGTPTARQIAVRVGTTTVTYDTSDGETADSIAAGLNTRLVAAGLGGVVASADGGGIRLQSGTVGSAASFDLNLDAGGAGSWNTYAGADVAGTIDGMAASGTGASLRATSGAAEGLRLTVGTDATAGQALDVTYAPGIAARLAFVATAATTVGTGGLSAATDTRNARITAYNDQITVIEDRLVAREANLRRYWSAVSTSVSTLQSQATWLAGQLASL